jgi:hypothetical protein
MGGKAMKLVGVETERKTTREHLRIQNELIPIISDMFNTEVKGVKYYRNKETHGDCDLLILNDGNLGNVVDKLKERFGPVHNNGNVYSFEYDKYQVDIIPQPSSNWESSSDFFDFDPTGNLMGKIAHKFGLKYGFQGLVYPFRTYSGRLTTDIVISKDSKKIFDFLGFDYDEYIKGFDTVEEIFEYIINSKYFCIDGFLMDNLNHIDRKRNAKRQTYQGFLEYINTKPFASMISYNFKNKEEYIDVINDFFPEIEFISQLEKLKRKDEENKLISEKFNGDLVMKWTGLKNKELGQCLSDFKRYVIALIGEESYTNWVINGDVENIFKYWYKEKYGKKE